MFRFLFRRKKAQEISQADKQEYLFVLDKILKLLLDANLFGQAQVIQKLIDLLMQEDSIEGFVKLINGIDMWGGAGAVWEIYIEDESSMDQFHKEIILLIDLMEKTNILGKGIKPIRNIFEDDLKNN